jgi:hypothetical protein
MDMIFKIGKLIFSILGDEKMKIKVRQPAV